MLTPASWSSSQGARPTKPPKTTPCKESGGTGAVFFIEEPKSKKVEFLHKANTNYITREMFLPNGFQNGYNPIRARSITEPRYLAIRQVIRVKLYNKLFVLKKFLYPISTHNTCPQIHMLPCPQLGACMVAKLSSFSSILSSTSALT